MFSKTDVRFMETFTRSAKSYFREADLRELARHLSQFPNDGIASDLSEQLRLITWPVKACESSSCKEVEVVVWFLVRDDQSTIDVIALDDEDATNGGGTPEDVKERLRKIAHLIYRAYRIGKDLHDVWDVIQKGL